MEIRCAVKCVENLISFLPFHIFNYYEIAVSRFVKYTSIAVRKYLFAKKWVAPKLSFRLHVLPHVLSVFSVCRE